MKTPTPADDSESVDDAGERLVSSDLLTPVERRNIRLVRKSFQSRRLDGGIRLLQRTLGQFWMHHSTKNLQRIYGVDRLPIFDPSKSYICVANHRSFFDMYMVTTFLMHEGLLTNRLLFPVRANFFYNEPLGLVVNGMMSFFAMYPPVFRERQKAALNLVSIDETVRLIKRGGMFVGVHPEGTRKLDDDPYTLLPAQSGVGRIIHQAKVEVIPVFVNGLINDLPQQVAGNITRKGNPITIVFGKPVDFGETIKAPPSPRTFKKISEVALAAVSKLGDEEREIRKTFA